MKTRIVTVSGDTFKIPKNTMITGVRVQGLPVHWRMSKTQPRQVQLRHGIIGPLTVLYENTEPVHVAAYYPITNKARK